MEGLNPQQVDALARRIVALQRRKSDHTRHTTRDTREVMANTGGRRLATQLDRLEDAERAARRRLSALEDLLDRSADAQRSASAVGATARAVRLPGPPSGGFGPGRMPPIGTYWPMPRGPGGIVRPIDDIVRWMPPWMQPWLPPGWLPTLPPPSFLMDPMPVKPPDGWNPTPISGVSPGFGWPISGRRPIWAVPPRDGAILAMWLAWLAIWGNQDLLRLLGIVGGPGSGDDSSRRPIQLWDAEGPEADGTPSVAGAESDFASGDFSDSTSGDQEQPPGSSSADGANSPESVPADSGGGEGALVENGTASSESEPSVAQSGDPGGGGAALSGGGASGGGSGYSSGGPEPGHASDSLAGGGSGAESGGGADFASDLGGQPQGVASGEGVLGEMLGEGPDTAQQAGGGVPWAMVGLIGAGITAVAAGLGREAGRSGSERKKLKEEMERPIAEAVARGEKPQRQFGTSGIDNRSALLGTSGPPGASGPGAGTIPAGAPA